MYLEGWEQGGEKRLTVNFQNPSLPLVLTLRAHVTLLLRYSGYCSRVPSPQLVYNPSRTLPLPRGSRGRALGPGGAGRGGARCSRSSYLRSLENTERGERSPGAPSLAGREEGRGGARGGGRGAGQGRRRDPLLLPLGPPRGPRSPGQQRRRRRSSHPGPGGPRQRSPHRSQEGGVSICSRVDVVGASAEDPGESG